MTTENNNNGYSKRRCCVNIRHCLPLAVVLLSFDTAEVPRKGFVSIELMYDRTGNVIRIRKRQGQIAKTKRGVAFASFVFHFSNSP